MSEAEQTLTIDEIEDIPIIIRSRSPSPQINDQSSIINTLSLPVQPESIELCVTPSVSSSMTSIQPSIRVEISEKHSSIISHVPRIEKERTSIQTTRPNKQPSPTKTPGSDQSNRKRYFYKENFSNNFFFKFQYITFTK